VTDTLDCIDMAGWETCKLEKGHERAGMTKDMVEEALHEMADALEENTGLLVFRLEEPDQHQNFMQQNLAHLFDLAKPVGHRIDQILKRNIVRVHVGMCVRVCGEIDVAIMLNVEGTLLHLHTHSQQQTCQLECLVRACECLTQCDSYTDATCWSD